MPYRHYWLAAMVLGLLSPVVVAEDSPFYTSLIGNLAVGGYDPVAYFTDKRARKGQAVWSSEYRGAIFRFASEANKQAFLRDPQKYEPQYGGYCAWAIAHGYTAKGSPEHWRIVDGKLYLNYNASVQRRWEQNSSELIARADQNWPGLSP